MFNLNLGDLFVYLIILTPTIIYLNGLYTGDTEWYNSINTNGWPDFSNRYFGIFLSIGISLILGFTFNISVNSISGDNWVEYLFLVLAIVIIFLHTLTYNIFTHVRSILTGTLFNFILLICGLCSLYGLKDKGLFLILLNALCLIQPLYTGLVLSFAHV